MLRRYLQLGLLHVALALTALPVDSTLNRVMIQELGLPATLAALLVSLPYLFAPVQVAVGAWADRRPLAGRRRTPYILVGLLLSVAGVAAAPAALAVVEADRALGLVLTLLAFGAWGLGFNFATASYFALASELFGEQRRSRAVAVMYVMMILTMIGMGITLSRMVDPYTPAALSRAVWTAAGGALAAGLLGLIGLEPRAATPGTARAGVVSFRQLAAVITGNTQARAFFVYLLLLLAAILGQDVILEPYAAQAFAMPVSQTTRLSSIYGVCFLLALGLAAAAERLVSKRAVAQAGAVGGAAAFGLILLAGALGQVGLFYAGLMLLGLAIGLSTVSNHSLLLDMTTPQNVGLFIGAWGMATSLARLAGSLLGGAVRDGVAALLGDPLPGYGAAFAADAALLLVSLRLLRGIDVGRFRRRADQPAVVEQMALANEA
jgi:BCD family chlorophyll transporter-like MFS transporter